MEQHKEQLQLPGVAKGACEYRERHKHTLERLFILPPGMGMGMGMRSYTDRVTRPTGEQPHCWMCSLLKNGTDMGDGFPPVSFLPCKVLMFPALNHWSHPSQRDSLAEQPEDSNCS